MLPDPKKVARLLKRTVFQNKAERLRETEIKRDVQIRSAKGRMRQFINQQHKLVERFTQLAKKALSLNDESRFRQAGYQILATRRNIERWEKYFLSLEMLEARREQVNASVELIQAVRTMSETFEDLAEPGKLGELQLNLEKGLAQADSMEKQIDMVMGMMDSALEVSASSDEQSLKELESSLLGEIENQEAQIFNTKIDDNLEKIRQELKEK